MKQLFFATLAAALIYTITGNLSAETQSNESAPTTILDVCEVLAHPLQYDGHLITIRGKISATDEGGWLTGDQCPGVFVTDGYVWPSLIALEMPTIPSNLRLHSVDFKYDWQSSKRVDAKYHRLLQSGRKDCIVFTYTGLLETRREWSAAKIIYPNGTTKISGFGHLNDAPAQLLIRTNEDVSLLPNCRGTNSTGTKEKK
jgi:hypothetical protein